MEGPSLRLAKEQLRPFKGKKILQVSGNTKIGKERLTGLEVRDIFSWGKHLVFQFDPFALRVHFMLFGTFEAIVDGISVTGDYRRSAVPRLKFVFKNGEISLFNCSLKYIEEQNAKKLYDFSIDIMSKQWDAERAYKKVKEQKNEQIADVLLDQTIFAGVGNIIKNEVLSITKIHPIASVESLTTKQLKEIVLATHSYAQQFYKWRKKFVLRKHYSIYHKGQCPHCGGKVIREKTGKRERWSYYCTLCQKH
jgi:endonuclease VIII